MTEKNIFYIENDEKHNNIWKKTDYFPLLETKEKFEGIEKQLKDLGFGKIVAFDELGEEHLNWECFDTLTLAVLPLSDIVNQDGKHTREMLENNGFKIKTKHYPIDIESEEIRKKGNFVEYFPTKNLIIAKINPFVNEELFKEIKNEINNFQPKFKTREEIWQEKLKEQWQKNFNEEKHRMKRKKEDLEHDIEQMRERIFSAVNEKKDIEYKHQLIDQKRNIVDKTLMEEMKKAEQIPVVKNIYFRDRIYVNFGQIYCNGEVITDRTTDSEGVEKPVFERKKVRIGELTFTITPDYVKVSNPESVKHYPHPHADTNGKICYGEVDVKVQQYLRELEITKLVKLLYSWACSYNDSDTHIKLQEFYDARQNDKET